MKNVGLLSSDLPSVIDWSNLSPSREFSFFYFYSNDDPRDPENKRQKRFPERRYSEQTSYNQLNGKAWLTVVVRLSANIPMLVCVDLIGLG